MRKKQRVFISHTLAPKKTTFVTTRGGVALKYSYETKKLRKAIATRPYGGEEAIDSPNSFAEAIKDTSIWTLRA